MLRNERTKRSPALWDGHAGVRIVAQQPQRLVGRNEGLFRFPQAREQPLLGVAVPRVDEHLESRRPQLQLVG